MSTVGTVDLRRMYLKCRCGQDGSYAIDEVLGVDGRFSRTIQKHACRLASETSYLKTSEHLSEMLGVAVCAETLRTMVTQHGQAMARFQVKDPQTEEAFRQAPGEVEFAVDAGKVCTREQGWKDLKIAVIQKRKAGPSTSLNDWSSQRLPAATITLAFAMIATAQQFHKSWRLRLRRLGVRSYGAISALADGASWIWKSIGRALTGCVQTLDIYHACEHLNRAATNVFGEGTPEAVAAYERARSGLIERGWNGVCDWVGELLSGVDPQEQERRRKFTNRVIVYFAKHSGRLNYAERLKSGRAIGSGVVEGWAKTLGLRLKTRGARWNYRNVQPIASLICVRHSSQQWESYWANAG